MTGEGFFFDKAGINSFLLKCPFNVGTNADLA